MTGLQEHLQTGCTTIARCWRVTRVDALAYGFTDHDVDLVFDGVTYRADGGLSARALAQSTGLAVDNSEAVGMLSDASISESDIEQGRFDGAEVISWLVNWTQVGQRVVQFRGTLGDIRRGAGAFYAELRGLTDSLNQPRGRVFQRRCSAVLGDAECGIDRSAAPYGFELVVDDVQDGQIFRIADFANLAAGSFERGHLTMRSGAARGLSGTVKFDRIKGLSREVALWEPIRAEVAPGDLILLQVGCDKRAETCRATFDNFQNFRGFPHIPGEDWLVSVPRGRGEDDGGSLFA